MLLILGFLAVTYVSKGAIGNSVEIGLISTIIASGVGYLTARTSGKTQLKVAETTTRGQVEEEAFERANNINIALIDRQEAKIAALEERVEHLEERVEHAELEAAQAQQRADRSRQQARRLAKALYDLRHGGAQATPDPDLDEAVIELLGDEPTA